MVATEAIHMVVMVDMVDMVDTRITADTTVVNENRSNHKLNEKIVPI